MSTQRVLHGTDEGFGRVRDGGRGSGQTRQRVRRSLRGCGLHGRGGEGHHGIGRGAELFGVADEILGGRRLGQGPHDIAERQEGTDDHESRVCEEIAERENDHSQAAEAEHFDLRDAVGRRVDIAPGDSQGRIADEKRGIKNHEVFQLEPDRRPDQRDGSAENEDRNRGGDERRGNEREDGVHAGAHIALQEPAQRDVAAVEGGQHAGAEEHAVSAENPRMLRRLLEKEAHHGVVSVNMPAESGMQVFSGSRAERPQGEESVEEEQQKELERADDVSRGHGNALAVHLDGTLPLLQVKPRAKQETDDDRNDVSPVVPIVGRQFLHRDRWQGRRDARRRSQQDYDRARDDEEDHAVAPFDAADIELLAEQNTGREDDEEDEREEKYLRFQPERHPTVADQREDRQGDGQQLIKEKNQAKRPRPAGEKSPERLRATILPPRKVMGDKSEKDQTEAVRNSEAQQADQAELRGELHREEQAQPPHPGKTDGIAPEQGVEPAVGCEFFGGSHRYRVSGKHTTADPPGPTSLRWAPLESACPNPAAG